MKKTLIAVTCLACWAGFTSVAPGQERPSGEMLERIFARLDTNQDDQIDKAEFIAGAAILQRLSAAGPGRGGEQGGLTGDRMLEMLKRFDHDGSGKVALADLPEAMRERLKRIDTNTDGFVDRSEVKAMMLSVPAQRGPGKEKRAAEGKVPEGKAAADGKAPERKRGGADAPRGRRPADHQGPQKPKRPNSD